METSVTTDSQNETHQSETHDTNTTPGSSGDAALSISSPSSTGPTKKTSSTKSKHLNGQKKSMKQHFSDNKNLLLSKSKNAALKEKVLPMIFLFNNHHSVQ